MDYQPLSGREFPRFSAIKTFFRLPIAHPNDDYDVAILGIPFDGGVSYRPGARFGPSKIRESSSLGRGFHWGRGTQIFSKIKCADIGDCPIVPIDLAQSYTKIEEFIFNLASKNKKIISAGGDHSITLPILRALKRKYGVPLNFIHFDAHFDTYPAAWNCEYHHGSFLRHAIEEGLINPLNTIQIGIRGPLASSNDLDFIKLHKITVFSMDDIRADHLKSFLAKIPIIPSGPTYISFDVDCLDPAYAPGTGTPVPGGLTTYEVQQILRSLKIKNLVGGDVVEVCPAYDHSDITSLVAVDVIFEFLGILSQ